jgi:hypothetical protein
LFVENSAVSTIAHNTTVLINRRNRIFNFDGAAGAGAFASGMAEE